jgi:hypothetical protein
MLRQRTFIASGINLRHNKLVTRRNAAQLHFSSQNWRAHRHDHARPDSTSLIGKLGIEKNAKFTQDLSGEFLASEGWSEDWLSSKGAPEDKVRQLEVSKGTAGMKKSNRKELSPVRISRIQKSVEKRQSLSSKPEPMTRKHSPSKIAMKNTKAPKSKGKANHGTKPPENTANFSEEIEKRKREISRVTRFLHRCGQRLYMLHRMIARFYEETGTGHLKRRFLLTKTKNPPGDDGVRRIVEIRKHLSGRPTVDLTNGMPINRELLGVRKVPTTREGPLISKVVPTSSEETITRKVLNDGNVATRNYVRDRRQRQRRKKSRVEEIREFAVRRTFPVCKSGGAKYRRFQPMVTIWRKVHPTTPRRIHRFRLRMIRRDSSFRILFGHKHDQPPQHTASIVTGYPAAATAAWSNRPAATGPVRIIRIGKQEEVFTGSITKWKPLRITRTSAIPRVKSFKSATPVVEPSNRRAPVLIYVYTQIIDMALFNHGRQMANLSRTLESFYLENGRQRKYLVLLEHSMLRYEMAATWQVAIKDYEPTLWERLLMVDDDELSVLIELVRKRRVDM